MNFKEGHNVGIIIWGTITEGIGMNVVQSFYLNDDLESINRHLIDPREFIVSRKIEKTGIQFFDLQKKENGYFCSIFTTIYDTPRSRRIGFFAISVFLSYNTVIKNTRRFLVSLNDSLFNQYVIDSFLKKGIEGLIPKSLSIIATEGLTIPLKRNNSLETEYFYDSNEIDNIFGRTLECEVDYILIIPPEIEKAVNNIERTIKLSSTIGSNSKDTGKSEARIINEGENDCIDTDNVSNLDVSNSNEPAKNKLEQTKNENKQKNDLDLIVAASKQLGIIIIIISVLSAGIMYICHQFIDQPQNIVIQSAPKSDTNSFGNTIVVNLGPAIDSEDSDFNFYWLKNRENPLLNYKNDTIFKKYINILQKIIVPKNDKPSSKKTVLGDNFQKDKKVIKEKEKRQEDLSLELPTIAELSKMTLENFEGKYILKNINQKERKILGDMLQKIRDSTIGNSKFEKIKMLISKRLEEKN